MGIECKIWERARCRRWWHKYHAFYHSAICADCSFQVTALGRLSSQANNSMGDVRIFVRAVSNPGPPDYSFDDIDTMPFTTMLSAQIAEWLRHSISVISRNLRHTLCNGGKRGLGYAALRWEQILGGQCGDLEEYQWAALLPCKTAVLLWEYNGNKFKIVLQPSLPRHREDVNIYRLIKNHQVIFPAILGVENTFATFPVFRNIWCYSQQCNNILYFRDFCIISRIFMSFAKFFAICL